MNSEEMFEFFKSIGAIEEQDDGSFRLTDTAEDYIPEMMDAHEAHMNNDIFSLWMSGMINVMFDEDGDAVLDLSEHSRNDKLQSELCTPQEIFTLRQIIFQYDQANS